MEIDRKCVERFVKHGQMENLIAFTAIQKYHLTTEEVYQCLISRMEKRNGETSSEKIARLVVTYRSQLSTKNLEALSLGFFWYGFASEGISIALLHPKPIHLFEEFISGVTKTQDNIEETFEVVHLVGKRAYDIYLQQCIRHGYYELAVKTAKIRQRKLTKKDYETMVKINLEFYTELGDAAKAAKAAGRKLKESELDAFVLRCMSQKDFETAVRALKLLKRPLTMGELKVFSNS